jgi:hypothetical protein
MFTGYPLILRDILLMMGEEVNMEKYFTLFMPLSSLRHHFHQ